MTRTPPFRVGQPVLCVDASGINYPPLTLWAIYTVATVRWFGPLDCPVPGWGILVEELPACENDYYWAEYDAGRFRPIDPERTVARRKEEIA